MLYSGNCPGTIGNQDEISENEESFNIENLCHAAGTVTLHVSCHAYGRF